MFHRHERLGKVGFFFFFQAEDGIRDGRVTGVQTCALPILPLLALAWVLRNPAVSVALTGCRSPREIEENVRALDVALDASTLTEIDEIMQGAAGQTDVVPGRHH